jgi:hypothetical protein
MFISPSFINIFHFWKLSLAAPRQQAHHFFKAFTELNPFSLVMKQTLPNGVLVL